MSSPGSQVNIRKEIWTLSDSKKLGECLYTRNKGRGQTHMLVLRNVVGPLTGELPYATRGALKRKKKNRLCCHPALYRFCPQTCSLAPPGSLSPPGAVLPPLRPRHLLALLSPSGSPLVRAHSSGHLSLAHMPCWGLLNQGWLSPAPL